jgi:glutamate/tyrosine decarboxylase-like PLP-dependent enzyme
MFKATDYVALLEQLEQFFTDTAHKKPVTEPRSPGELAAQLPLQLSSEGESLESLQDAIAAYLQFAVKTAHPAYFNQLWGGFEPACFMGELLTSAANTSMYTYEVAPVATLIERTLIQKMGELAGFAHPDGQFTTGGSNGNLMAMALARHQADPELKTVGMTQRQPLVAFVSAASHYSFAKAASLLGIGSQHLIPVPTDEDGKMRVDVLESLLIETKQVGSRPFFVAGTAGTTVQGAYDPFEQIASVAKREGLWFHIDGAWGAGVLLSAKQRHLMQGVEQADSLVWDAHKMMGMTLVCSVLLVQQQGAMLKTFATQGTDYIFHAEVEEPLDLGPATMHCGRRADAIKLWLAWKQLGDRGWEARINRYFELAAYAEAKILADPSLQLVTKRESLNLCFQFVPDDQRIDRNHLNLQIRQALVADGRALVNYARIDDNIVFRLVLCNNQTTEADLDEFFAVLISLGQQFVVSTLQELAH